MYSIECCGAKAVQTKQGRNALGESTKEAWKQEAGRASGSKEQEARKCCRVAERIGNEERSERKSSEGCERKQSSRQSEPSRKKRQDSEEMRGQKREQKVWGA